MRMRDYLAVAAALGLAGALAGCAAHAAEGEDAQAASGQVLDAAPATPPPPQEAGGPPPMPQPITLAQRPNASGGEALYIEHCMACHGPNGMGEGLLGRRMDEPLLEKRANLTVQFVELYARQGLGNMPAIPRGEVSDAEMRQIAEYLAAGPHGDAQ